ncbi:MAG TPA: MFS transporter [Ktedonobacterales bacterium]|nr:MFS transporter [Ktedonobacterales bacterium]
MTRKPLREFWLFFGGETISNLGSSFTLFALPLLVYRLTDSALYLALSTVVEMVPYLLFGLMIGAWVDRINRKRLMIVVDVLQALTLAFIPAIYALHSLSVWWIYGVGFVSAALKIGFESAQFAAIPQLVAASDLDTANGRIQASFSLAQMLGPVLAGALLFILPLPTLVLLDAASFLVSAGALLLIRVRFNAAGSEREQQRQSVRQDVIEGLRYVLKHPVLRAISLMTPIMNFLSTTTTAQLVLLAVVGYHAGNAQVGFLYAAGSLGIVLFSLLAGPVRQRWSFSKVAIFSLVLMGSLLFTLGFLSWYWGAVVVWGLSQGAEMLFNVAARSLRQAIVPDQLLGRVISVAMVLGYSSIPLGALAGGLVLQRIGVTHVAQVYAAIGLLICVGGVGFSFGALGHAERYLPKPLEAAVTRAHSHRIRPALHALFAGMRAVVPLALTILLPMALYGVTALKAGLSPLAAQALSISVFSGAILPAVQALSSGTPLVVVGLLIVLLNLRHLLYSAKLAPQLRRLPWPQRLLASYLLADEVAGAEEQRAKVGRYLDHWWSFLIGAGATMWLAAQGAVAVGIALGGRAPVWGGMSLLPTLAFIGLTLMNLKRWASVVVAGTAGVVALSLSSLPMGLGLLIAVGLGMAAGQAAKRLQGQPQRVWVKEEA